MISCDSTWFTVSIATPTTISSDVPPKKNGTPSPCVNHCGRFASSVSPMNGIGADLEAADQEVRQQRDQREIHRADQRDARQDRVDVLGRPLARPNARE